MSQISLDVPPSQLHLTALRAGYKWGDQEPPTATQAPVTKWLADFLQPGVTHTQAILALVAWGNAQPAAAGGQCRERQQRAAYMDVKVCGSEMLQLC